MVDTSAMAPRLKELRETGTFGPWLTGLHLATGSHRFMGLVKLLNSSVLVEIPEAPGGRGHLLLWNPIAMTAALERSLREIEERTGAALEQILNPFDWHHFSLLDWQAAFPAAEIFVVSERPLDLNPDLKATVLDPDEPELPGTEGILDLWAVPGCLGPSPSFERNEKWKNGRRHEIFVRHRPSSTLLVGDMFHYHRSLSFMERMMRMREEFTFNSVGFRVRDRARLKAFLDEVLGAKIERALTVHGSAIAEGGESIREDLISAIESAVGSLQ